MVDCRKNCGSGPDSLHTHLNELMLIQVGKVSEENVVEMSFANKRANVKQTEVDNDSVVLESSISQVSYAGEHPVISNLAGVSGRAESSGPNDGRWRYLSLE